MRVVLQKKRGASVHGAWHQGCSEAIYTQHTHPCCTRPRNLVRLCFTIRSVWRGRGLKLLSVSAWPLKNATRRAPTSRPTACGASRSTWLLWLLPILQPPPPHYGWALRLMTHPQSAMPRMGQRA